MEDTQIFLENKIYSQLAKEFPAFMEPTVYKGWQWILADVTSIQSNCKEG
jgi:hypothetical protein